MTYKSRGLLSMDAAHVRDPQPLPTRDGPAAAAAEHIRPPQSWRRPEQHLETLLSSPWYRTLGVVLDEVADGSHSYFRRRGARLPLLPVTTGAVSSPAGLGSDSVPVAIRLGQQTIYLSDSMQFHLELAVRLYGTECYYIMPSFRGERSDERHLNEFFHVETELPGGIEETLDAAEGFVRFLGARLVERCETEVAALAGTTAHLRALLDRGARFPRIRYRDAVDVLRGHDGLTEERSPGLHTITPAGERRLLQDHGDFIWLTHFPRLHCPFYQAREPGTGYALTADLLAGRGEILGAGQRITTADEVRESLVFHEVDPADYDWYIRMKSIAPLATSGFGLGIERFLLWLTQTSDIRNCTLLLREHGRVFSP